MGLRWSQGMFAGSFVLSILITKITNVKFKTLELLNKFRNRLFKAKDVQEDDIDHDDSKKSLDKEETIPESTDSLKAIFTHRLELDEEIKVSSILE